MSEPFARWAWPAPGREGIFGGAAGAGNPGAWATRVFAEILAVASGFYRQADVQVVADRVGVGKGTVYRYFPTKEALFFGAVDAGMRALVECVDAAANELDDPVEHLKRGIRSYLGFSIGTRSGRVADYRAGGVSGSGAGDLFCLQGAEPRPAQGIHRERHCERDYP
jgi:AcrR family transcriptional regulator